MLYVPAALALFGLVQVVYYGVLGAQRQHPLHSIMVFDLGGISHFAKDNVFPGSWSKDETALITDGCYKPLAWDIYWTQQPCAFVMEHLEARKDLPLAGPHRSLETRDRQPSDRLSRAPRDFHGNVPSRREQHDDVDARPRRRLENHICG